MNENAHPKNGHDRRTDEPPEPSWHHLHREGGYLGIDADIRLDYGDGTATWLADRLRRPPDDQWQPRRSAWLPERDSWEEPQDNKPGTNPSADSGSTSRPLEGR
jgi:hypothetical protein